MSQKMTLAKQNENHAIYYFFVSINNIILLNFPKRDLDEQEYFSQISLISVWVVGKFLHIYKQAKGKGERVS